jgi:hypothetical protein
VLFRHYPAERPRCSALIASFFVGFFLRIRRFRISKRTHLPGLRQCRSLENGDAICSAYRGGGRAGFPDERAEKAEMNLGSAALTGCATIPK